jgi:hypothetical protein
MGQKPDMDQGLSDAELLAMPAENVSPATLTRVWELHARHTQEKAQEAVETAVQQHRQADQKTEHEQEEERRHERVILEYQETMRAVEQRSDQLLAKIDREERRIEERRREIETRAIRLHDGRRVYVDGEDFRDGEGRALSGSDRTEAAQKAKPDSAQWADKQRFDDWSREAKQLKGKVHDLRKNVSDETYGNKSDGELRGEGRDARDRMTGCEREFTDRLQDRSAADTAYGATDYSAFKTTSFAHAIAPGDDKALRTDFAPASDGTAPERPNPAPAANPAPSL